MLTPDAGKIVVNGRTLFDSEQDTNIAVEKRNLGYVSRTKTFPHYTVQGNLNYGVRDKDHDYFNSIVELLALKPLLSRYPKGLSGGRNSVLR